MTFPTKQALLAYLYSLALSAWAVVTTMVIAGWALGPANGGFSDGPTFLTYMGHVWFAGVLGLVFSIGPYARAKQGYTAAATGTVAPPPEQNQPPAAAPGKDAT